MAPGVIRIEGESLREASLNAECKAVIVGRSSGEILRDGGECGVGCSRWQSHEAARTNCRRAVSVQSLISYRNVAAMHAGVIDPQDGLESQILLDFEVPLVVGRLMEHAREVKEVGSGKRRNRRGNRVEAPAGFELREQCLIRCGDSGEQT